MLTSSTILFYIEGSISYNAGEKSFVQWAPMDNFPISFASGQLKKQSEKKYYMSTLNYSVLQLAIILNTEICATGNCPTEHPYVWIQDTLNELRGNCKHDLFPFVWCNDVILLCKSYVMGDLFVYKYHRLWYLSTISNKLSKPTFQPRWSWTTKQCSLRVQLAV